MPYIKTKRRDELNTFYRSPDEAGDLNYWLTCAIIQYWEASPSYQRGNDIIGALEGAKLEFYRRIMAPYEDKKIEENGDVYLLS